MTVRSEKVMRACSPELIDILHDILICVESIGGYSTLITDGALERKQSDTVVVESRRGHFQIHLPFDGMVSRALNEQELDSISVRIEPLHVERQYSVTTRGLKQAIESTFQAGFLRFYVSGEAILNEHLGGDDKWNSVWRFAWAVRNAIAHNGKINIRNPNKKPVEWDGLQFAHSDNGHPVLAQDVGAGDLVVLMIAMDHELRQIARAVKQPVDLQNE